MVTTYSPFTLRYSTWLNSFDSNFHFSQWIPYLTRFPLPQQNQHHPWSVTEQMQDNIDSTCHRTIYIQIHADLCKFAGERRLRRSYCHKHKKLQENWSHNCTKYTKTRDSRIVLQGSFQLVVSKKAFDLNFIHEFHPTKELLENRMRLQYSWQFLYKKQSRRGFFFFNNNLNLIKSQQMPHRPIWKVYYTVCGIKAGEESMRLVNIYTQNEGNLLFSWNFFECLSDLECKDIIIVGHFNLVTDIEKD